MVSGSVSINSTGLINRLIKPITIAEMTAIYKLEISIPGINLAAKSNVTATTSTFTIICVIYKQFTTSTG